MSGERADGVCIGKKGTCEYQSLILQLTRNVHNSIIAYTKVIFLPRRVLPTDITRLEGWHNDGAQYGRLKIIVHVDLTESNDSVRVACTFFI